MARALAQKLQEKWSQSVVVDNRPGGNTIIGTEAVARSTDQHTLLFTTDLKEEHVRILSAVPHGEIDRLKPLVESCHQDLKCVLPNAFTKPVSMRAIWLLFWRQVAKVG